MADFLEIQLIEQEVLDVIEKDIAQLTKQDILMLQSKVNDFISDVENSLQELEQIDEVQKALENFTDKETGKISSAIFKTLKEQEILFLKLQQLAQKGYLIGDLAHKFFTGEAIPVKIGVSYYNKIITGTITIEELISKSALGAGSQIKKLSQAFRLQVAGSKQNLINSLKNTVDQTEKFNKVLDKNKDLKNQGRSFEILQHMEESKKRIYNKTARKRSGGGKRFTKGPDTLFQTKFYGDSKFTFSSLDIILNAAKDFDLILQNMLSGGNKNQIKNAILDNFADLDNALLEPSLKQLQEEHIQQILDIIPK